MRESEFFKEALVSLAGIGLQRLSEREKEKIAIDWATEAAQAQGFASLRAYRQFLESKPRKHPAWSRFLEELPIHRTRFFRQPAQLRYFSRVMIPRLQERFGNERLRIWSIGCSTGEEPYSVAMMLESTCSGRYAVLATDLDENVLNVARLGMYPRTCVHREVPPQLRHCFEEIHRKRGFLRISPRISAHVEFRRHNLVRDPWPRARFHVIFFRNVLQGMDLRMSKRVLQRVRSHLFPGAMIAFSKLDSVPEGLLKPMRKSPWWIYEND